ncbi:MAG TPA: glycosyltransferase [Cytophagaceae bacterium]|jgi:cellulose synthase/poly-beta-1,6-N-acetylglucosamine synthase-like glycosyltransferase|nr:glycosyltransferase [Cytophagaceae bacterium]
MNWQLITLIIYFTMLFSLFLTLIIIYVFRCTDVKTGYSETPFISILLAARNEEKNIHRCLEALARLNYPATHFEVLIGNDQSEDVTAALAEKFTISYPNFKLIHIESQLGHAKGKANVLAQLAHQAKGEFYFITDADILVPENWIREMLSYYTPELGTVSGLSLIDDKSILSQFQNLEWIFAFGMVKVSSEVNIPVSAVGNNMFITKEAYWSTGGYENIPFSVTEDFQLFRETLKKGWKYKTLANQQILAYSKPMESFCKVLSQRKRWMQGAVQLPLPMVIFLSLQSIFFPFILATLALYPLAGIVLWIMKIFLQNIFNFIFLKRIKQKTDILIYAIPYELYSGILSVSLLFYFLIPGVKWKGRKYS